MIFIHATWISIKYDLSTWNEFKEGSWSGFFLMPIHSYSLTPACSSFSLLHKNKSWPVYCGSFAVRMCILRLLTHFNQKGATRVIRLADPLFPGWKGWNFMLLKFSSAERIACDRLANVTCSAIKYAYVFCVFSREVCTKPTFAVKMISRKRELSF